MSFWLNWLKNRGPWFTWWFNYQGHLFAQKGHLWRSHTVSTVVPFGLESVCQTYEEGRRPPLVPFFWAFSRAILRNSAGIHLDVAQNSRARGTQVLVSGSITKVPFWSIYLSHRHFAFKQHVFQFLGVEKPARQNPKPESAIAGLTWVGEEGEKDDTVAAKLSRPGSRGVDTEAGRS